LELLITTPEGTTTSRSLAGHRISLGRSPANELAFPDDNGLSRVHMALEREGSEWFVTDLGSKNGTYVNGVRIEGRHRLEPGDQIVASRVLLSYPDPRNFKKTVVFEEPVGAASSTIKTTLQELLSDRAVATQVTPTRGRQWTTPIGALIRAGRELSIRRPLPQLFRVILDLSLEAVGADRGVLLTLENDELVMQASHGENFRISTAVRDRVLKERTSVLVRDTKLDEQLAARQSIVFQGVRSLMAAPLQTDDRVIGLIYVDTTQFYRTFTNDDLNLLTVMANVAAIRIEHQRLEMIEQAERLLEIELEQAGEIQQKHLPAEAPRVPGVDLAGHNQPSRAVGGDYFDFIPCSEGKVAFLVADVAGKGMPAALLMMSLQARVQVLAENGAIEDVAQFLSRLNRSLATTCPGNRFVTCFAAVLEVESGQLTFCNAGHNPPMLAKAGGEVMKLDGGGPVLGLFTDLTYQAHCAAIGPGDTLIVYSDGVTDAESPAGEEFGEERLKQILIERRGQPARQVVEAVTRAVGHFTENAAPVDDLTIVVATRL
jgi:phosphoserine phosphatase RsbU/P